MGLRVKGLGFRVGVFEDHCLGGFDGLGVTGGDGHLRSGFEIKGSFLFRTTTSWKYEAVARRAPIQGS